MTSQHDRVAELLPWLVNGTLEKAEEGEVRRHLSNCVACREQLALLEELGETVRESALPKSDSAAALDAMRRRIDEEVGPEAARPGRPASAWRWIVLAQAAALVVAVLVIFMQRADPAPPAEFRTLSEPATTATESPTRARVLFAESASELEIRQLLLRAESRLVDGPSQKGLYTVELAASGPSVEARVEQLRADPSVRFIELVARSPVSSGDPVSTDDPISHDD